MSQLGSGRSNAAARPSATASPESVGTNLRYSGAGLGYQLASIIAGGPAPLIAAAILEHTGSSTWISWYIIGCCVIAFVALLLMPRRAESAPASEYDAAVEHGATAAWQEATPGNAVSR